MSTCVRIASGRLFNLLQPHRSTITIDEVAHSLSHLCRFTGHVHTFYSVAQHAWLVSWIVEDQFAMDGLLHEVGEALLGDLSSPAKQLVPGFKSLEHGIEHSVLTRMGHWNPEARAAVKRADRVLLVTEQRDLMPPGEPDPDARGEIDDVEPLPWTIEPLPSFMAKALFLRRFEQLGGVR